MLKIREVYGGKSAVPIYPNRRFCSMPTNPRLTTAVTIRGLI